jgi:hypothetical protein
MKAHREASVFFCEDMKNSPNLCDRGNDENDSDSLVLKIGKLNARLERLTHTHSNAEQIVQEMLGLKSDQLQWLVYTWKHQSQAMAWYFEPTMRPLHIGRLLKPFTSSLDQTYMKLKHLSEASAIKRVELKSPLPYNLDKHGTSVKIFRQDILPLDTRRIVCVNFGSDHSLYLEAYDAQTGEHVRTVRAYERGITYFPNSCAHGDHFCVSFTAEKEAEEQEVEQNGFHR